MLNYYFLSMRRDYLKMLKIVEMLSRLTRDMINKVILILMMSILLRLKMSLSLIKIIFLRLLFNTQESLSQSKIVLIGSQKITKMHFNNLRMRRRKYFYNILLSISIRILLLKLKRISNISQSIFLNSLHQAKPLMN